MKTTSCQKLKAKVEGLVTKQQLKIEDFNEKTVHNEDVLKTLNHRFIGIGQPLNDNILKFNNDQLAWVFQIKELVDSIEP